MEECNLAIPWVAIRLALMYLLSPKVARKGVDKRHAELRMRDAPIGDGVLALGDFGAGTVESLEWII
ncbi:MAG: hypothetical protein ACI92G_001681 [Candidatus Pelagisphaera sp.]|jgi:hypothetical protein